MISKAIVLFMLDIPHIDLSKIHGRYLLTFVLHILATTLRHFTLKLSTNFSDVPWYAEGTLFKNVKPLEF